MLVTSLGCFHYIFYSFPAVKDLLKYPDQISKVISGIGASLAFVSSLPSSGNKPKQDGKSD